MSDSVWPHRWQPTRLPRPWDSPGKNTGVGCHFLLQCMKVKSESEVAQSCLTPRDPMDCSLPGSSIHGIFQARVLEWVATAFSEAWSLYNHNSSFSVCVCCSLMVNFIMKLNYTEISLLLSLVFWKPQKPSLWCNLIFSYSSLPTKRPYVQGEGEILLSIWVISSLWMILLSLVNQI